MKKTTAEVTRESRQEFRVKQEVQPTFRPRYEAQASKVKDSTKDIDVLLGSKANITKQEHVVSVGIAKRTAADHLSSLGEEISFINDQMKDTDSRDVAIQKLQSSIASTSAISQGFSGDAAMAYDDMYTFSARQMTTKAISSWQNQQNAIDKNRVLQEFKTFLGKSYTKLPPTGAKATLDLWKSRLTAIDPALKDKVDDAATEVIIKSIVAEIARDPSKSMIQVAEDLKDRSFQGELYIDPDGLIHYTSGNLKRDAAVGGVLNKVFKSAEEEKKASASARAVALNKIKTEDDAAFKRLADSIDESTPEGKRAMRELDAIRNGSAKVGSASDDELFTYVTGKESKGTGGYTAQNPNSTAYGKYQFLEKRAKELWKEAGFTHPMVHGEQTPDEQDAMWDLQKKYLRNRAISYGQVDSAENMYIIHQLGPGGSKKYFNDVIDAKVLKAMNGQLGDNARTDFRSDPEGVLDDWVKRYNPSIANAGASARGDGEVSKSELIIAKKIQAIRKRQATSAKSAAKVKSASSSKVSKTTKATVGMWQDKFLADPTAENNQYIVDAMKRSGEYSEEEILRESKKFENYEAKVANAAEKVATAALVVSIKSKEDAKEKAFKDKSKQDIKNIDDSNDNKFDVNSLEKSRRLMTVDNERAKAAGYLPTWSSADFDARKIRYAKEIKEKAEELLKESEAFEDKALANNLSNVNTLISDQLQIMQDTPLADIKKEIDKLDSLYAQVNTIFRNAGKPEPFPKAKELRDKAVEKENAKTGKSNIKANTLAAKKRKEKEVNAMATGLQIQAKALHDTFVKTGEAKDERAWQKFVKEEGARFKKTYLFNPLIKFEDTHENVRKSVEILHKIENDKAIAKEKKKLKEKARKDYFSNKAVEAANIKEDYISGRVTAGDAHKSISKLNSDTEGMYGKEFMTPAELKSWRTDADTKRGKFLIKEIDDVLASKSYSISKGETTEAAVLEGLREKAFTNVDAKAYLTSKLNTANNDAIIAATNNPMSQADEILNKKMSIDSLDKLKKLVKEIPAGEREKYQDKIDSYEGSEKHRVDIYSAKPLDEPLDIRGLSSDSVKAIKENKISKLLGVIQDAANGNDNSRSDLAVLYGTDRKTAAPGWLQQSAAKEHLKGSMIRLNDYMKAYQNNPLLMNNDRFISAGRSGMGDKDRARLGLYRAFINVNPQQEYDDVWQQRFEIAFSNTNYKRAIKDATGEDVPEYVSSDEMTSFFEDLSSSKIPVDEKIDAFLVALTMDKMGMSDMISETVGRATTKYQTYDDLNGGRIDSFGVSNILTEVDGDPLKMWSIVRHAIITEHDRTAEEADIYRDAVFEGAYVIRGEMGGKARIIFDSLSGSTSLDGEDFEINERESKVVRLEKKWNEELLSSRAQGLANARSKVYKVVYQKERFPEPELMFAGARAMRKKRESFYGSILPDLPDIELKSPLQFMIEAFSSDSNETGE